VVRCAVLTLALKQVLVAAVVGVGSVAWECGVHVPRTSTCRRNIHRNRMHRVVWICAYCTAPCSPAQRPYKGVVVDVVISVILTCTISVYYNVYYSMTLSGRNPDSSE